MKRLFYITSKPAILKKSLIMTTIMAISTAVSVSAAAATVSVSNYPLLLLSHAVTGGHNDAEVLLSAGDVGHHGALSPSKMKLITDSRYVVWFGDNLEQNLVKNLRAAPNAISLLDMKAFNRYPLRNLDGSARSGTEDPHLWLDPANARAIVRALAVIHSHANPEHKAVYQANADAFVAKMHTAVAGVKANKPVPYWAYHDAYQYIEQAAGLTFAGALTPDHHLAPKASQFRVLNSARPQPLMCLVSQGAVSDGVKNKLGKVNTLVLQEDMSGGANDFISAWTAAAMDVRNCAS